MKESRIGCSGFVYPGWKGKFYPADLARSKWLAHYSSKFNTVELNGTFYRFPLVKSFKTSYNATPPDFKFSVKAHKIITHSLRLKPEAREKIDTFIKIAEEGLEEKLGCILYQMPPSFKYTEENLENILSSIPHTNQSVIEFRNPSWWNEVVYNELDKSNIIFCNNDYPGMPEEIVETKGRFYMRFHGKPVLYKSEYTLPQLKKFVKKIPAASKERYVYFNNTWFLAAIANAMSIREMME
ncbi:MAG TPA: DUF72 domain-containing protein [Bacteroidia bacterium]|jgi:uncharacterized protein YecE (DUF72 family)